MTSFRHTKIGIPKSVSKYINLKYLTKLPYGGKTGKQMNLFFEMLEKYSLDLPSIRFIAALATFYSKFEPQIQFSPKLAQNKQHENRS